MNNKNELSGGWDCKNFEDFFEFQKKVSHTASEGKEFGKYKFFTSSNIQNKYVDQYDFDGEFLIFGTGGNASIHYCNERFAATTDCLIAKTLTNKILTKYVYYYFISNINLLESGFRGAALKHISKNYIKKIKIKYPLDTKIQGHIISVLEKAKKLKDLRRQSDELSREYLNSVFFNTFGDPSKNEKKWRSNTLEKCMLEMKDGPMGFDLHARDYVDNGIPLIRILNIKDLKVNKDNLKFISLEKHEELKKSQVEPEDIIISKTGKVGEVGIVPIDYGPANLNQALARIKVDQNIVLPEYLVRVLNSDNVKIYLTNRGSEKAIQPGLKMSDIKNLIIPLPPIDIQKRFNLMVDEIEKIKEYQTKSRQQIDNLIDCLLHKAFQGELYC